MQNLADIDPKPSAAPKVSIVVAACNEESAIEASVLSLITQDYQNLEIVLVNDRSTDQTGTIIDRLQQQYPKKIKTLHISDLPNGWLGKNNALAQGSRLACGEYFIFTDADVVMEKTTVSRAVTVVLQNQLDHLSLIFKSTAPGSLLNAMTLDVGGGLLFTFRPWKAKVTGGKHFMGVGAFNMVRASTYQEIGGHEPLKMHPIDDIMLGKILKSKGYRQDCLIGCDFVTVRWYENPKSMIAGLMKNVFALSNYKVSYVLSTITLITIVSILPLWGVFFSKSYVQILFMIAIAARLVSYVDGGKFMGASAWWHFPWALVTPYINIFIVLKATIMTIKNGGIEWRGTQYPLEQLRKNESLI